MRRRSAGARAGNALAARGQLAGALGQRCSDLALWRARIRRLHGFCEFLGYLSESPHVFP